MGDCTPCVSPPLFDQIMPSINGIIPTNYRLVVTNNPNQKHQTQRLATGVVWGKTRSNQGRLGKKWARKKQFMYGEIKNLACACHTIVSYCSGVWQSPKSFTLNIPQDSERAIVNAKKEWYDQLLYHDAHVALKTPQGRDQVLISPSASLCLYIGTRNCLCNLPATRGTWPWHK